MKTSTLAMIVIAIPLVPVALHTCRRRPESETVIEQDVPVNIQLKSRPVLPDTLK